MKAKLPRPAPKWLPKAPPPWEAWDPWRSPFCKDTIGANPALVPNIDPGLVPNIDPGLVPNIDPGLVPNIDPGLVPNIDPGLVPNIDAGLVPNIDPGLVPNIDPGLVPNIDPGLVPNIDPGLVPNIDPGAPLALGCVPDTPDHRDLEFETHLLPNFRKWFSKRTVEHPHKKTLSHLLPTTGALPKHVRLHDRKQVFRLPTNQGNINSCTAHAVCGLMEYLRQSFGETAYELSRMFLYYQTRQRDGHKGNVGSSIRSAIHVLNKIGVPPEELWPNLPGLLDRQPARRAFVEAQRIRAGSYYRLDGCNARGSRTLTNIKRVLAAGYPVVLGVTIFESTMKDLGLDYVMPFPKPKDKILGSHALLVLGYQDWPGQSGPTKKSKLPQSGKKLASGEEGYLIVRNSWGTKFADYGFGYLDYRFVLEQLVVDCWTVFSESDPLHRDLPQ